MLALTVGGTGSLPALTASCRRDDGSLCGRRQDPPLRAWETGSQPTGASPWSGPIAFVLVSFADSSLAGILSLIYSSIQPMSVS